MREDHALEAYLICLKERNQVLAGLVDLLEDTPASHDLIYYDKQLHLLEEQLGKEREQAGLHGGYRFAESIKLQGACRLDCGRFYGDVTGIERYLSAWIKTCPKQGTDVTLYEMGTYLSLLIMDSNG